MGASSIQERTWRAAAPGAFLYAGSSHVRLRQPTSRRGRARAAIHRRRDSHDAGDRRDLSRWGRTEVVKNVAGLDMSKLMIGSFGTLAAIAVVNFKLIPQPPCERTFRFSFAGLEEAVAARDAILKSPLDPAAIDLLNPAAAEAKKPAYMLAVRAGGNAAAIARYEREL